MPESPFLIVGLGNPGSKYAQTRHNVGFLVLDALVRRWGGSATGKFQGELYSYPDRHVHLLKPQTFMNLSGQSVVQAVGFFKVSDQRLLVVSDDLDLPVGQLRLRKSGGAGGHNGLKSILELLGTDNFPRLRIGIGRPPEGATTGHVLGKIAKSETKLFEEAVALSADAVEAWMTTGIDKTMNAFNRRKDEP